MSELDIITDAIPFEEDLPREDIAMGEHHADELLLNIDGYEGPIEVLLVMARDQKVDLSKISILQLVRQYLAFVDRAAQLRLDLAAEYLVMAAWLAYLKSRLLLPRENKWPKPCNSSCAVLKQCRKSPRFFSPVHNLAPAYMPVACRKV
jgi:segregation and condensation protein A